jgi:type IV pilus assembly protein PilY1
MFRKLTLASSVLLLVVLLRSDTASAIDEAACCAPTTSRLDALMNPTKGSDENFFSRPGGPPNILFMVDTSGSMAAWPAAWPDDKGCGSTFINGLGYNKDETYPRLWTGINQQSADWFNTSLYYIVDNDGYGVNFGQKPTGNTWAKVTDACSNVHSGMSGADKQECAQCLDSRGYYVFTVKDKDGKVTARAGRAKGNFLNFYAPRDSGAVKVLADIVRDLREVRFGIMAFRTKDMQTCWGPFKPDTSNSCMCVFEPMGPTCDKSYPMNQSAMEHNRNSILNKLTNVTSSNTNGLGWGGCNTPLADALYTAGYYMQSKTATTPFTDMFGEHETSAAFTATDGVCFECGFNAIILLTDGEPNTEQGVVKLPEKIIKDPTKCPGCTYSHLHKVAKYLWEGDLRKDMTGQQRIATYTIGFSEDVTDSKLLAETARLGGGSFYPARSTSELKQVILTILDEITGRNTSFATSAINTLQTQSAALTAVVPRMFPSKTTWAGRLYRYEQFNEFVEGQDKNGDNDQGDIFLVDKDGSIVAEDTSSEFRKVVSAGADGTPVFGGEAMPYWEASQKLATSGHAARKIWTVVDNGANGGGSKDGLLTDADGLVEFKLSNLDTLQQYLAVGGAPLCPHLKLGVVQTGALIDRMKFTGAAPLTPVKEAVALLKPLGLTGVADDPKTQAELNRLCAALVIQYVRGMDIFNEDSDPERTDTRKEVLGDIFHSSPTIVDPPVDKFLCDIGVSNQCIRTLYSEALSVKHTPLVRDNNMTATCKPNSPKMERDSYEAYHFINRKRERLILVGANDGMLHAFSDGKGVEDGNCNVSYPSNAADGGTERWAFIPPDLLPRLQEMLSGHAYYVDGDIMVRDIWVDLNENGKKDVNEFRTMAVVAEGRGGTHYFALELQWKGQGDAVERLDAEDRPGFRWMFPQPCTDEAQKFGKTLLSLSPKPPPIGPVLLETTSSTQAIERHGRPTVERWVAMLSGGWSPGAEKGRGLYMVDVWRGTVSGRKDNLLWKWEFDPAAAGSSHEPRKHMTHGFVAPVAMADYGSNENPQFDGFFDTAVVGDLGGQLWTLRFFEPGVVEDPGSKLVKNWSGARAFSMDKEGISGGNALSIQARSPFFYLSSLAMQPDNKALRAFVGTGNRYSLLDKGAGTCRFDNPQACARLGCGSTVINYKLSRNVSQTLKLGNEWTDRRFKAGSVTNFSTPPANLCSVAGDEDFLVAEFEKREVGTCPPPSGNGSISYEFARPRVECGQDAEGVFDCRVRDAGNLINMRDLDINPTSTLSSLGKNRFYGVWAYGGTEERTFAEDPGSASANQAKAYDERRLSDSGGVTGWGNLVDVTNVQCNQAGGCTCMASKTCGSKLVAGPDDAGWFFEYEGMDHKTASGSAVLASCTLWNTMYLQPEAAPTDPKKVQACGASGTNRARFHQGDYISGAPNCAAGFRTGTTYARALERSVLSPPPEPATAIQVSAKGQVKHSALLVEPGKAQATEVQVSSDMDVLQYVYELPVSESLHVCRHDRTSNSSTDCLPSEL